jgi:hypothetical protein
MRPLSVVVCIMALASTMFGQAASGTITGVVTDPAGAVVPGASVEVKNTDTGVIFPAVTTNTGSYSANNLPIGTYSVSVTVPGFKKYTHTGMSVAATQVLNVPIGLEVGAASESVTVNAEASLLKTESGDLEHSITIQQLDNLPVLGIGGSNAGSSGVRNPFNSTPAVVPGVVYAPNFIMIVNGAPTNTAAYRVEGLDNTNHTVNYALQENEPSPDAIQEVAVQTSNYAAEFGQAGGGLFNITMKSGTNGFHGSGYEYFVNEDLNAAIPFTNDGSGHKIRPRNRRNDFGGTIGGPVWIPKIYNGHNRTFFFFGYEMFREASTIGFPDTVPTAAYRNGDFSGISVNGNATPAFGVSAAPIGTDALGRNVYANEIFDPQTRRTAPNGTAVADPFQGNMIPVTRFDPVSVAIMKLMPAPGSNTLTGNYAGSNLSQRITKLPSLKVDHNIGTKDKLAFFWSLTGTDSAFSTPNGNADGLPEEISQARGTWIHSLTERLNWDRTIAPNILFHLGAGYSRIHFFDQSPYNHDGNTFNCSTLGLLGCQGALNFPTIGSTVASTTGAGTATGTLGGMQQMGNAQAHTDTHTERPAFNSNLTWIRGNHTFKGGAEVWFQGAITAPPTGVTLCFNNIAASTVCTAAGNGASSLPANLSTNAVTGFPFASFLLGGVDTASQTAPNDARMGKSQWALFLQDSWKVTRRLSVDYGVRWDYATAPREQYGRSGDLGMVPDPAAGGRIGAPIFETTCNCTFVKNYPYAIGPRLGFAYQINDKTVIRGGWGIAYGFAPDYGQNSANVLASTPSGVNTFFQASSASALPQPTWPNFNAGQTPLPGQITAYTGFTSLDRNAARPPRQNQWSVSIQREISRNFVLEGSYISNTGVWWSGPAASNSNSQLALLNQISPAAALALGLNPYTNPADNLLLSSALSSPAVIARVGNLLPYSGYSTGNTLANALRPYPQFSTIGVTNSPTGDTWYNALNVRGTKRMSHGLQAAGAFTWSKSMVRAQEDIFNPNSSVKSIQATDQPFAFLASVVYQTQNWFSNKVVSQITRDWQISSAVQYQSGMPLAPPTASTANNLGTSEMVRVPGQSLYLKDLNCGCINPYVDQVLNPAAWANPVAGTFGPGPSGAAGLYYTDFRQARRPQENLNIGRNFVINRERNISLQLRAEFVNVFNRMQLGNPSTASPYSATNAYQGPTVVNGRITGGFGGYALGGVGIGALPTFTSNGAVGNLYQQPRQGTLIARFTF